MIFLLVLAAGAGFGLACVHFYRLLVPGAPDLIGELDKWELQRSRATRRAEKSLEAPSSLAERAAAWASEQFRSYRPENAATFERDLAITGSTLETWMAKAILVVIAGFLAPFALGTMFRVSGAFAIPFEFMILAAITLAVVMLVLSYSDLRKQAARARENFRDALSGFLDMLVMSMEGGRGHAEALPAVAEIGTGWEYEQLWHAIDNARTAGITPWESLGQLGERYGINELAELRTTLTLAQDEGGKIRDTLIARAQAMRETRLADAAARANQRTEAMSLNLLFMAFLGAGYVLIPRLMQLASSH
jgi:Flp pilus assembly protein TadB